MFMVLNTHTHTRFERQIDGLLKCILKSLDTVAGFGMERRMVHRDSERRGWLQMSR